MLKLAPFKYQTLFCLILTSLVAGNVSVDSTDLSKVDPLQVPLLHIKQNSGLHIDLSLKNNIITGLRNAEFVRVSGFGPGVTEQHALVLKVKHLRIEGEYAVKGQMIFFPIKGSGAYDAVADDVTYTIRFRGSSQHCNDATYMTATNMVGTINPQHVTYKFDNLFIAGKSVSKEINSYFNAHWMTIWEELRGTLEEGVRPMILKLLNDVFAAQPYAEFVNHRLG